MKRSHRAAPLAVVLLLIPPTACARQFEYTNDLPPHVDFSVVALRTGEVIEVERSRIATLEYDSLVIRDAVTLARQQAFHRDEVQSATERRALPASGIITVGGILAAGVLIIRSAAE